MQRNWKNLLLDFIKDNFINLLMIIVTLLLIFLLSGGTEQLRARNWGGHTDISVQEKVTLVTWKNGNLWVMTREPKPEEAPETYQLREYSGWGVWQGTVTIKETFKTKHVISQ